MIEPVNGKGANRAKVTCDGCGRSETMSCDYLRRSDGVGPNVGQLHKRLVAQNWDVRKTILRCPTCAARKRAMSHQEKREDTVQVKETVEDSTNNLPEPTPKQERLIILAIENAWDDQNKRYRGGQTDKTVAEELAGGIRAGWVAELRNRYFGPDGGNDELAAIRAEIEKFDAEFAKRLSTLRVDYVSKMAAFSKRLDAVCEAVGPKAGKVSA